MAAEAPNLTKKKNTKLHHENENETDTRPGGRHYPLHRRRPCGRSRLCDSPACAAPAPASYRSGYNAGVQDHDTTTTNAKAATPPTVPCDVFAKVRQANCRLACK